MNIGKIQSGKSQSFEGLIVASKWDEMGNIIGLNILTKDEDEISISMNKNGISLTKHCKSKVQLKGYFDDLNEFTVTQYEVMKVYTT